MPPDGGGGIAARASYLLAGRANVRLPRIPRQAFAFPLQFEFLFDFPGPLAETRMEGLSPIERALMALELAVTNGNGALPALTRVRDLDAAVPR